MSQAKTPTYCCNCNEHDRTDEWRTDYCRAKQMLCVQARGGVMPVLQCGKYAEKFNFNKTYLKGEYYE